MSYRLETNNDKLIARFEDFLDNKEVYEDKLDSNYLDIRKQLLEYSDFLSSYKYTKYEYDLKMGLRLYKILNSQKDFSPIYAADSYFWKYMALYVIPDIIYKRWSTDNINALSERYYKNKLRIYPFTLYWYIHLSWQGSEEETYNVLSSNSTDEIMQLVERPGKIGVNVSLYREIMLQYSKIDKNIIRQHKHDYDKSMFRMIMQKNLSKCSVFRPEIYPGGIKGYVKMLFSNL